MDKITVVGLRKVSFKDDNGRQVDGDSIFYTMVDDRTEGVMAGKMFISRDRAATLNYFPKVGDLVSVFYDRYGRPSEFGLVK